MTERPSAWSRMMTVLRSTRNAPSTCSMEKSPRTRLRRSKISRVIECLLPGSDRLLLHSLQPLLKNFWIDNTRLTIQASKKQLKMSELALRQKIMNVVTTVEQAYYDLLLARERIKVQQQALDLAERLVKESKRRVDVGTMARLDE